jgi:hypothetical protein
VTAVQPSGAFAQKARLLLVDIRLAPPQFVRNFLEGEEIERLTLDYLLALSATELELLAGRWREANQQFVGSPAAIPLRRVPNPSQFEGEERPEFMDRESVREMMRGMFLE